MDAFLEFKVDGQSIRYKSLITRDWIVTLFTANSSLQQ